MTLFGTTLNEIRSQQGLQVGKVRAFPDGGFEEREKELLARLFVVVAKEFAPELSLTPSIELLEESKKGEINLCSLRKDGKDYLLYLHRLDGDSGGYIVELGSNRIVCEIVNDELLYSNPTGAPWPDLI